MMDSFDLLEEARSRFGMDQDSVGVSMDAALERVLVAGLTTNHGTRLYALVSPAADLIAERVRDIDVPRLTGELVAEPGHEPRMLLAAATMLGHASIKPTAEGRPNRSQLKRLAAQAGVDVEIFETWVVTAVAAGLVDIAVDGDAEVLRPRRAALVAAAGGEYPRRGLLAAMSARLARGPMARAAIGRMDLRMFGHRDPRLVRDAAWYARAVDRAGWAQSKRSSSL